MLTFIQHQVHFMLDYKRGQCMPVDHAHLLLWKWPWIIWPERSSLEGELSESICPKSQTANVCPFFLPQNVTRLRWQAAPVQTAVCVQSLYVF